MGLDLSIVRDINQQRHSRPIVSPVLAVIGLAKLHGDVDRAILEQRGLRAALVQLAAVTADWIDAIGQNETAYRDIEIERSLQDQRWGKDRHLDPLLWSVVLGEEIGEVSQSVLDGSELVQVAAVVIAWLEDIDNNGEQFYEHT